jgi:hypothetical protein
MAAKFEPVSALQPVPIAGDICDALHENKGGCSDPRA